MVPILFGLLGASGLLIGVIGVIAFSVCEEDSICNVLRIAACTGFGFAIFGLICTACCHRLRRRRRRMMRGQSTAHSLDEKEIELNLKLRRTKSIEENLQTVGARLAGNKAPSVIAFCNGSLATDGVEIYEAPKITVPPSKDTVPMMTLCIEKLRGKSGENGCNESGFGSGEWDAGGTPRGAGRATSQAKESSTGDPTGGRESSNVSSNPADGMISGYNSGNSGESAGGSAGTGGE